MKFKTSLFLVLLCGLAWYGFSAVNVEKSRPAMASPLGTPSAGYSLPTMTGTPIPVSTPTVGYQATIDAQSTEARALNLTLEANQVIAAQLTQRAKELEIEDQRLQIEQTSIPLTAQAFSVNATQTGVPLAVELQNAKNKANEIANENAKAIPTLTQAAKDAELYIKYGDDQARAEIFFKYAMGAAFLLIPIGMILAIRARKPKQEVEDAVADPSPSVKVEPAQKPLPTYTAPTEKPTTTRRNNPEVPCTESEFMVFANGIINDGMGLEFLQWRETKVYRRLSGLRYWLWDEGFAAPNPTHPNEFYITDKSINGDGKCGMWLLEYYINRRELPEPYRFKFEDKENEGDENVG